MYHLTKEQVEAIVDVVNGTLDSYDEELSAKDTANAKLFISVLEQLGATSDAKGWTKTIWPLHYD